MVQLFFLSIVFNGVAGFLFIFGDFEGDRSAEDGVNISAVKGGKLSAMGSGFRLVMGILAAIVGILKLFLPYHEAGGGIFFLGDLLPAVAGMAAGFLLIFGFYREYSSVADVAEGDGSVNHFGEIFFHYKKAVGIALIIMALLHFLFPSALFL